MSTSYQAFQHKISLLELRILTVLAGLAFVCGFIGFRQYEFHHGQAISLEQTPTALYHALQMMILHTAHLDPPIPFLLHFGRLLAAVVFFYTAVKVIQIAIHRDWSYFKIRWRTDHVIICGLGELGLPLAIQAAKQGLRPVAIEKDANAEGVHKALQNKVPVLIGDATDPAILLKARADRAKKIYIVCSRDETNIGIATTARQLKDASNLSCRLFIADPEFRTLLHRSRLFSALGPSNLVNVQGLDVMEVSARQVFAALPLDHLHLPKDSNKTPWLILFGFGEMGREIALQAARLAHFPSKGLLQIAVIDHQAEFKKNIETFKKVYPNLDKVAKIHLIENNPEKEKEMLKQVLELYQKTDQDQTLLGCFICHDKDDLRNMRIALIVFELFQGRKSPIRVYLKNSPGLVKAVTYQQSVLEKPDIKPFGQNEAVWNLETLEDEVQDQLARAHHIVYIKNLQGNRPVADNAWSELDETYKAANRAIADHLRFKLHAIGYHMCIKSDRTESCEDRLLASLQENKDILSEIEHARWCAERWLAGWEYNPIRNNDLKHHDQLLDWDDLKKEIQDIDESFIENIPLILKEAGQGAASSRVE